MLPDNTGKIAFGDMVAYVAIMSVRLYLITFLFLLGTGNAYAACTDAAAPGINWRRCYQDGRVLENVDLTGANLREVSFQRTDLSQATLKSVDAYRAKFVRTDLSRAILDNARLTATDFTRASLDEASLQGADLRNAKLVGASLRKANLTGAVLDGADLRNADLSGAIWLDGVRVCADPSIGQCL